MWLFEALRIKMHVHTSSLNTSGGGQNQHVCYWARFLGISFCAIYSRYKMQQTMQSMENVFCGRFGYGTNTIDPKVVKRESIANIY